MQRSRRLKPKLHYCASISKAQSGSSTSCSSSSEESTNTHARCTCTNAQVHAYANTHTHMHWLGKMPTRNGVGMAEIFPERIRGYPG
jgi:hypothetical protein